MILLSKKTFNNACMLSLIAGMSLFGSCKGPEGDPGPAGKDGVNGTNGTNGTSGKDGVNGTNGVDGATGPQGEQGIPGVDGQKAFEDGFIKGTIKGIRRDGTPFEEPFVFRMTEHVSLIHEGRTSISIAKYLDNKFYSSNAGNFRNEARFDFTTDGNLNQVPTLDVFDLDFRNPLASKLVFAVNADAGFDKETIRKTILPISDENNGAYKFLYNGRMWTESTDKQFSNTVLAFENTNGDKIYYSWPSGESWGEFLFIIDQNGIRSTSSDLYSKIKLGYPTLSESDFFGQYMGFYSMDNKALSTQATIPVNSYQITNYQYKENAQLSFDYKINVNAYDNTTMNPLEITGSVQTTAYNGMVLRKSFE